MSATEPPTPGVTGDGLEAVLAAHQYSFIERVNADDPTLMDYGAACSCGDWNAFDNDGRHLDHLAAQVREVYLPESANRTIQPMKEYENGN